jgi:hypothetical protein
VAVGMLAMGLARRCGGGFGRMIERMPDDAPPKWILNSITAIRQNTERILSLLEAERGTSPPPADKKEASVIAHR